MKRLLIGVGIAMSAIAIVAAVAGGAGTASADGPEIDIDLSGLDQLAGIEAGDWSDLPAEPEPAAAAENPAPAAPIEQPSSENNEAVDPQVTDAGQPPSAPAGAAGPIALPSTGAGTGGHDSVLIIAGFAFVFAMAGLACFGGARALEAGHARER
ncbi:MAG TPA: hypothetical protein VJP07_06410 [Dehalococcoidia bacterium]|nr:hypothetical protein [Dehalococcoidia bacterium]